MKNYSRILIINTFQDLANLTDFVGIGKDDISVIETMFNSPNGNEIDMYSSFWSILAGIFNDIIDTELGIDLYTNKFNMGGTMVKTFNDKIVFACSYDDKDWSLRKIDPAMGRLFITFSKSFDFISVENKPFFKKHKYGNTWEEDNEV